MTGLTAIQYTRMRQEFERGLLAVIINDDREVGLQLMAQVAQNLGVLEAPGNDWDLLQQWLMAICDGRITLTSACFVFFREAGKALKGLDQTAQKAPSAEALKIPELAALRFELKQALVAVYQVHSVQALQWVAILKGLNERLISDVASPAGDIDAFEHLRLEFEKVRSFASRLNWSDALEISGAQINLMDRILDGTLASASEHWHVFSDAKNLLSELTLPSTQDNQSEGSQIDDAAYERVIERADVLASGGEFDFDDDLSNDLSNDLNNDLGDDALVHLQLAALLDALPGLLEAFRQQTGDVANEPYLAKLAAAADELQQRLESDHND